ncbi:class I SAM-dependent methyltransferase, partial [Methylogaea oryzae]|uniref:class I SAM-dependent methyltransferase n=1 Tax=Methylogaea oryzae TaxID=1295382 RepID=UPI000ABCC0AD
PATLARLYQHAPTFAPMHRLLDETIRRLPHKHGLRILEIGAGTGGTSAWLLPHLGENCEYVFTDVSAHFFDAARQRFAAYPCLQFRKLDIEQPPQTQGFEAGRYDLVVASNVLHATRDLAATVGHARSLLAPGGQLLLVEGTAPRRWIDLIFGLLEGWWAFADHALRPYYPCCPPNAGRNCSPHRISTPWQP